MIFNIRALEEEVALGGHEALLEAAALVKEEAIKNMPRDVPDDQDRTPGTKLAESVNITHTEAGVIISVDTPYAAKQEFDVRLHHPRGGGPNYLGNAMKTLIPRLEGIVAGKVYGNVKRARDLKRGR